VGFQSSLLNDIVSSLPQLQGPIKELLEDLDIKQAREGVFTELWTNPEKYPAIEDAKDVCIHPQDLDTS
jgi:DNA mismatch repair protein MSH3